MQAPSDGLLLELIEPLNSLIAALNWKVKNNIIILEKLPETCQDLLHVKGVNITTDPSSIVVLSEARKILPIPHAQLLACANLVRRKTRPSFQLLQHT